MLPPLPSNEPFTHPDDLCATFTLLAHEVWTRRGTAKRVGFPFWEVTITQQVLLDLAARHSDDIKIAQFRWGDEAQTGADWEWCFHDVGTKTYFRTLVQAKALNDQEIAYDHLDHTIGNSGVQQIERLIDTAQKRQVPALYVFYNYLTDDTRLPKLSADTCPECWGISVAFAESVRALLPDKTFDSIKASSRPWTDLVCCEDRGSVLPDRVAAAIQSLRLMRKGAEDTLAKFSGGYAEPNYVRQLFRLEEMPPGVEREQFLQEMSASNPGVTGIVYVRSNL